MAEQQALLERPIEAAAHSDSEIATHTSVHTRCLIHRWRIVLQTDTFV